MMDEFRVKVTVRNNLLLSAIEAAGYKTQTEFARAAELGVTAVNSLIGLRVAPIGENGEFGHTAKVIMEVLGACPTDLWTEAQLTMKLDHNTGSATMSGDAVQAMLENNIETMALPDPSDSAEHNELTAIVSYVLETLTPRESKVIRNRFGIGLADHAERTFEDVAKQLDVTRERVRQIEAEALRKIRHPSRLVMVADCVESDEDRANIKQAYGKWKSEQDRLDAEKAIKSRYS